MKKKSRSPLVRAGVALSMTMVLSSGVHAQVATSSAPGASRAEGGLEEIVVTARRTSETLQTVPVSVAAFSEAKLEQMNVANLLELSAFVPNMMAMGSTGNGITTAEFAIRGIGQTEPGIVAEPGVGLYIDGIYYPRAEGALLGLVDVERIEVLRGPQGTLFGKNTIGGAIQYVSKKPEKEFGGWVKTTLGSYNRQEIQGTVNVPLTDDLYGKISFKGENRDGFVNRLSMPNDPAGRVNDQAFRAQLRYNPSSDLDVNFTLDRSVAKNNGRPYKIAEVSDTSLAALLSNPSAYGKPLNALYVPSGKYTNYGVPELTDITTTGVILNVSYKLNPDLTLKSLTGYRRVKAYVLHDYDATPLDLFGQQNWMDEPSFSQELQLNGISMNKKLNWVAGVYYFQEHPTDREIRTGFADATSPINRNLTTKSVALFGQGTYSFGEALSATAGLRYSTDDKKYKTSSPQIPEKSVAETWSNVSPRLGLEYKVVPDVMLYTSVAMGFRSGGFNPNAAPDAALLPNNNLTPYKPETLTTYELGLRSEMLNKTVRFNATAFMSKFKDLQAPVSYQGADNRLYISTTNAARATISGFELEFTAAVTDGLTLGASSGVLRSSIDEIDPLVTKVTGATTSTPIPFTPKLSYALNATFKQPLTSGANVVSSLDYGWKADMTNSIKQDDVQASIPKQGVLNGRIQFNAPKRNWSLALVGTNLTNTYVITGATNLASIYSKPANGLFPGSPPLMGSLGASVLELGRPREFGVEFNYKF